MKNSPPAPPASISSQLDDPPPESNAGYQAIYLAHISQWTSLKATQVIIKSVDNLWQEYLELEYSCLCKGVCSQPNTYLCSVWAACKTLPVGFSQLHTYWFVGSSRRSLHQ